MGWGGTYKQTDKQTTALPPARGSEKTKASNKGRIHSCALRIMYNWNDPNTRPQTLKLCKPVKYQSANVTEKHDTGNGNM